jgi:hypothetical protein
VSKSNFGGFELPRRILPSTFFLDLRVSGEGRGGEKETRRRVKGTETRAERGRNRRTGEGIEG